MNKYLLLILAIATTTYFSSCSTPVAEVETVEEEFIEETQKAVEEVIDVPRDETGGVKDDGLFKTEKGAFEIKFPGEPRFDYDQVPTEIGNVNLATYIYEEGDTKAYMVSYTDYPPEIGENSDVDDLLYGGMEGALGSLNISEAEAVEEIELQGHKGLYFKGNDGATFFVEYKLFLSGSRLYQIALLQDKGYASSQTDLDFLESFRMIK